jgi:hypothetical protein
MATDDFSFSYTSISIGLIQLLLCLFVSPNKLTKPTNLWGRGVGNWERKRKRSIAKQQTTTHQPTTNPFAFTKFSE